MSSSLSRLSSASVRITAQLAVVALCWMMPVTDASAQGGPTIIRDAEIEGIIQAFAAPLFQAAGFPPKSVKIRLIQSPDLNAFVAGGRNMYIHTGLLLKSEGPDAVIGVMAHETGHIEGGHLIRTRVAIEDASMIQLIGTILGAVAAVGAQSPDLAQAAILGSQSTGMQSFLKYSRTQESAADQAAIRLLDATGRSAKGLEGFLSTLGEQEVLSARLQDPYARTHPLSRERIDTLRAHIATSPNSDNPPRSDDVAMHDIMVAKLFAYIEPFQNTMRRYPQTDQSFPARYARVIAHFRKPDIKTAMPLLDELIADMPQNPFLQELKGQMLFEHARPHEALAAYENAHLLMPDEPLILTELARVELEIGTPDMLERAVEHFRTVHRLDGANAFTWRQLGIAYGRLGNMGMSSLALAEGELRTGQLPNARYHAGRAVELLKKGTSAHLQAEDVLAAVDVALARRAARKK